MMQSEMRRMWDSGSRPRRASVGSLVVAGTLLLAGCGDGPTPEQDDMAGAPPLQGLHFDTLAVLGNQTGEPWEAFGGVWDLAVGPDGTFAVLDAQAPAVHLYDAAGTHRTSIAEVGFTMGALNRPSGVAWSDAGDLYVWDPSNRRISRYQVGAAGATFADMRNAETFGETGFCVLGERTYLSFLQDGQVVHEVAATGGITRSFSEAPPVTGIDDLSELVRGMASEDLTPSRLFCADGRMLEVSNFQPRMRLHDADGTLLWNRELADFTPVLPVSPDDMGLGFEYSEATGSHMARSIVPWGEGRVLVQYELRFPGARPAGSDFHALESRLIDLETGAELDRTRDLPLFLGGSGNRVFEVRQAPVPQVTVLERHEGM